MSSLKQCMMPCFPITIEPKLDKLVRIGMIFHKVPLIVDSLPKLKAHLDQLTTTFEHGSDAENLTAKKVLLAHPDVTRSYLRQTRNKSPESRSSIELSWIRTPLPSI